MRSAAFSAIMMAGMLVPPVVLKGMMDESMTRRFLTPFTLMGETYQN